MMNCHSNIASEAHWSGLYEYQTPRNKPRPKTSEYIGVSKCGITPPLN